MRRDLHGLVLDTRCPAGEDPAALLLGMLPEAAPGAPADLAMETAVAGPAERAVEGEVVFRLRGVELRAAGEALSVVDAGGIVRLPAGADTHLRILVPAPLDLPAAWAFSQVPLLVALLAHLRPRGLHHLHAGALLAPDGRSVVVAGPTGSGKSTLAAALALAGCGYLGDDVVLVGPDARLLAFPRAFHLSDTSAAALGASGAPLERRTSLGKRALDPRALFPGRERGEGPAPAVLLFPAVEDRAATVLRPLGRADALGRLAESSALVAVKAVPGAREHLALLGRLADGASAFEVGLGRDLLEDAARTAGRVLGEALP